MLIVGEPCLTVLQPVQDQVRFRPINKTFFWSDSLWGSEWTVTEAFRDCGRQGSLNKKLYLLKASWQSWLSKEHRNQCVSAVRRLRCGGRWWKRERGRVHDPSSSTWTPDRYSLSRCKAPSYLWISLNVWIAQSRSSSSFPGRHCPWPPILHCFDADGPRTLLVRRLKANAGVSIPIPLNLEIAACIEAKKSVSDLISYLKQCGFKCQAINYSYESKNWVSADVLWCRNALQVLL